jgi:hypothetical protein
MTLVWDCSRAQSTGDLLLLLAIADFAHDDGTKAFPSVGTLANKARMDRRSVQRSVARLVEIDELAVKRGHGRNNTNAYTVLVDNLKKKGDILPGGATSDGEKAAWVSEKGGRSVAQSINEPSDRTAGFRKCEGCGSGWELGDGTCSADCGYINLVGAS